MAVRGAGRREPLPHPVDDQHLIPVEDRRLHHPQLDDTLSQPAHDSLLLRCLCTIHPVLLSRRQSGSSVSSGSLSAAFSRASILKGYTPSPGKHAIDRLLAVTGLTYEEAFRQAAGEERKP